MVSPFGGNGVRTPVQSLGTGSPATLVALFFEGQKFMMPEHYEVMNVEGGRHVKMWTRGVPVEDEAKRQLENTASMPFIFHHVAAMPDVHVGIGATVGSVVATKGAIIPACV